MKIVKTTSRPVLGGNATATLPKAPALLQSSSASEPPPTLRSGKPVLGGLAEATFPKVAELLQTSKTK